VFRQIKKYRVKYWFGRLNSFLVLFHLIYEFLLLIVLF